MEPAIEECAADLLEVVPVVMRSIRTERDQHRAEGLTSAQFHMMRFLRRHPDTSLVGIAEHFGLTLPTVSKMIDGLVMKNLVTRQNSAQDRRRIILRLTLQGEQNFDSTQRATLESLVEKLKSLSPAEREGLAQSLRLLRVTFSDAGSNSERK